MNCDEISVNKKISTMKVLDKHYDHLKWRGTCLNVVAGTAITIVIPVITLTVLGVGELIYLPSQINAKYKLHKLGYTMYIDFSGAWLEN